MAPTGVGGNTLANDPRAGSVAFVTDPGAFFELTEKHVFSPVTVAPTPGSGVSRQIDFPAAGVIATIRCVFVGTVTVALGTAGTCTGHDNWPYGLLDEWVLGTGASTDVHRLSGQQLHMLRALRNPGFVPNDTVDVIPGGAGAGAVIPTGANVLVLTWEMPVAIDPTSLIGSLYSQSANLSVQGRIRQAVTADLLTEAGTAGAPVIAGTWTFQVTSFEVPIAGGEAPQLVVPDLSRVHGLHSHRVPFANTGDVRAPLIRRNGQLDRLLFAAAWRDPAGAAGVAASYLGAEANAAGFDRVRIEYAGTETPLDYNPAHFLAAENLQDYADQLPLGYALDFLKENAPRDVYLMTGVTDLTLIPTVNAAVVPAAGARIEVVQETLFAPAG
jgi:hypothetical protein